MRAGRVGVCLAVAAAALCLIVPAASAQVGRITGQIRDDSNKPVVGATVVAESPTGAPSTLRATTDRKGRFAMIGLRPGMWTVTVVAPGFESVQGLLRVSSVRTNPPVDLRMRKLEEPIRHVGGLALDAVQEEIAAADELLERGRHDEAVAAYRALLAKLPALTTLNLQIGRALARQGDREGAAVAYQAALDAGAAPSTAHLRLAEIALDRGEIAVARTHLERAIELAPSPAEADEARARLAQMPPR